MELMDPDSIFIQIYEIHPKRSLTMGNQKMQLFSRSEKKNLNQ